MRDKLTAVKNHLHHHRFKYGFATGFATAITTGVVLTVRAGEWKEFADEHGVTEAFTAE